MTARRKPVAQTCCAQAKQALRSNDAEVHPLNVADTIALRAARRPDVLWLLFEPTFGRKR